MAQCALCKKESVLIKSHLIPKSAYKHVRGPSKSGASDVVRVSTAEGVAHYSDGQVTMPLLCNLCEDLFSKNGERVVGTLWATDHGFPLRDILMRNGPLAEGERFSVFDCDSIDLGIKSALFYFAISIFWRANVWDWQRKKDAYVGALGARYEEAFRLFLLGQKELGDAWLLVTVNSSDLMNGLISFPVSSRNGMGRVHLFDVLGLKFMLTVGRHISPEIKKPFALANSNILLLSAPLEESPDFIQLAKVAQAKVEARGRLLMEEQELGS